LFFESVIISEQLSEKDVLGAEDHWLISVISVENKTFLIVTFALI